MSKLLRRPMFRGGPVSSYGTGIASGLADGGRVGLQSGGAPFNVNSGLKFVTTGEIITNGIKKYITPDPWGLIILFYNYFKDINSNYNNKNIIETLECRINEDFEKLNSKINNLPIDEKEFVTEILDGNPTPEIMKYINLILKKHKNDFEKISPGNIIHKINNKIFIMHGANDSMVPYTESEKLAKNLKKSDLFISYLYEHREIASHNSLYFKLKECFRMISFFASFFEYDENKI